MSYDCVCDYDAPSVYSATERTARKPHKCYECSRVINPGERYEYVFAVYEGEPWPAHTCPHCLALREWVKAHVPCFCWAHGNVIDDAINTVREYAHEAPGLLFGAYRRQVAINRAVRAGFPI